MDYNEWSNLENLRDDENPFSHLYRYPEGQLFYVEPAFYTQLMSLKDIYPSRFRSIIDEMERIVKTRGNVVFTMDFENPVTKKDGFIYLEITDITDQLHIYVEDKSRGSDYGD